MIGGIQPFDLLLSLYKYGSRGVVAVVFFSSLHIRSLPLLLILSCLSAVVRLTKKKREIIQSVFIIYSSTNALLRCTSGQKAWHLQYLVSGRNFLLELILMIFRDECNEQVHRFTGG